MTAHSHQHLHADGTACNCATTASVSEAAMAIDPVCGMTVQSDGAKHVATHEGQTYYFCSAGCRQTFLANPAQWAQAKDAVVGAGCCGHCGADDVAGHDHSREHGASDHNDPA